MKFAIDVLFLAGSKGSPSGFQVLHVESHVTPWRLVWHRRGASHVIELAAGAAAACEIEPGGRLVARYL